jgi:nitrate/nitrite transport system ATP-binding protein
MSSFLEISQLGKIYPSPKGPAVIVENFDLRIRKGEFITLIGHSGCGKSTVLSMIAGLTDITSGGVILSGKEVVGAGPDRGVVFQAPCLLPWLTALENVMLGVDQVYYTAAPEERRQIAEYYLTVVGLADAMNKKPAELSQGMRQRCGIARAFALSPKMLLLDEPFGMLDSLTRVELQEVLIDLWQKDQKTALMVTHDVDEALFLSDRVVMMTNGPAATVGEILEVKFPRPRTRKQLLEDPEYYRLREELIGFLEERSHHRPVRADAAATPPPRHGHPSNPAAKSGSGLNRFLRALTPA